MRKFFLFAGTLLLSACAQFQTNDSERSQLNVAADQQATAYLDCIKRESLLYQDVGNDAAFVYTAVEQRCAADMDAFKSAKKAFLSSTMMMTDQSLQAAVEDLNRRARAAVAEQMVAGNGGRAAAPAARSTAAAAVVTPRPAAAAGSWNDDQRVYLDCMLEQARLYSALQESAETIAEVAQNKCRTYLGGPDAAGLAQEGRARVLSAVFDARVVTRP